MKRHLALFLALALLGGFGYGQTRPVLGVLVNDLDDQFVAGYAARLKSLAAKADVELRLLDSRSDQATQFDHLATLLAQGLRYFIIMPNRSDATEALAKTILARGGGAVFTTVPPTAAALKTGKAFFLVSSPETGAGLVQADLIDQYYKKNPKKLDAGKTINALLLQGRGGDGGGQYATEALKTGLAAKGYSFVPITEAADGADGVAESAADGGRAWAREKMDGWIAAYGGKFNIVVAEDDSLALGAVESLFAAGLVDDPQDPAKDSDGDGTLLKFPVLGLGATQAALKSMAEGKLFATVLRDAVGQASAGFELALALAKGSYKPGLTVWGLRPETKIAAEPPLGDPAVLGQCYLVPFRPVTKDNYKNFLVK